MLAYAVKLTRDPGGMTAGDVETLRRAGFDDPAILDICQVTAYYAYVNRLADGLGVELEERWRPEELVLPRSEFEAIRAEKRVPRVEQTGNLGSPPRRPSAVQPTAPATS